MPFSDAFFTRFFPVNSRINDRHIVLSWHIKQAERTTKMTTITTRRATPKPATVSEQVKARLRLRGIKFEDSEDFARMVPWTRLTFLLCGTIVAIATTFMYAPAFFALLPMTIWGTFHPVHPMDMIYNSGIRRFTKTQKLPPHAAPTRFACAIATVWLTVTGLTFHYEMGHLGCYLGYALTAVAYFVGTTHFCIPSAIYQFFFGDRSLIKPAIKVGTPS